MWMSTTQNGVMSLSVDIWWMGCLPRWCAWMAFFQHLPRPLPHGIHRERTRLNTFDGRVRQDGTITQV